MSGLGAILDEAETIPIIECVGRVRYRWSLPFVIELENAPLADLFEKLRASAFAITKTGQGP